MYGVILTAHGSYASGLNSGLELIQGKSENVRVCDFVDGDGFTEIDAKINKALDELKGYEGILILTDLAGGTPFNRSVMLTQNLENVAVFSGMNFQAAYTAIMASGDLNEAIDSIISEGKNGITNFNMGKNDSNEEEEDGI